MCWTGGPDGNAGCADGEAVLHEKCSLMWERKVQAFQRLLADFSICALGDVPVCACCDLRCHAPGVWSAEVGSERWTTAQTRCRKGQAAIKLNTAR